MTRRFFAGSGAPEAPCAVCSCPTIMRVEHGDSGHVPMCSTFCENAWPRVSMLYDALHEAYEVLALCTTSRFSGVLPEDVEAERVGSRLGYGALMSAASRVWARMFDGTPQQGSQHTTGPAERTVEQTLAQIDAALRGESQPSSADQKK